jgi:hypothetical protein
MLERHEGKLSRAVLRRGGGSNLSFLFGIVIQLKNHSQLNHHLTIDIVSKIEYGLSHQ